MQKSLDFLSDGSADRQKGKFYIQNPRSVEEACFLCKKSEDESKSCIFST